MQPWFYATKMLCCHLLSGSGTRLAFYVTKRVVIYCVPQKQVLRGHTEGEGIQRGRRGWKPRKPGCSVCTFQTTLFSTADQEEEVVGTLWLLPSIVTNSPVWVPRPQPHTYPLSPQSSLTLHPNRNSSNDGYKSSPSSIRRKGTHLFRSPTQSYWELKELQRVL